MKAMLGYFLPREVETIVSTARSVSVTRSAAGREDELAERNGESGGWRCSEGLPGGAVGVPMCD